MKSLLSPITPTAEIRRRVRAFTLVEIMVTMAVFTLLLAGVIYSLLFGLNLYTITGVKLAANDDARKSLVSLVEQIRSANTVMVGSGGLTNFTQDATGVFQTGTALQIQPTTNQNVWYRYYYEADPGNPNYCRLMVTQDGLNSSSLMAYAITNLNPIFTSEDSYGNPTNNNLNNRVIGVWLQFHEIQYPLIPIGPGNYYTFYQLHTRVTRRLIY